MSTSARSGCLRRILLGGFLAAVAILLLIQLVPYGRAHENPPVRAEPAWTSPEVRRLAVAACFDCHSNQTLWTISDSTIELRWTNRDASVRALDRTQVPV